METLEIAQAIHEGLFRFVKTSRNKYFYSDLAGACALGSFILYEELKNLGLFPKFVLGTHHHCCFGDHCWVELNNDIIDVTATQFNESGLVVCPIDDHRYMHDGAKYDVEALLLV